MTIAEARKKVVDLARSQLGYCEGANNYTKYAADPMISRLYGWTPQNQPWCCTFVNWVFLTAFGWDIGSQITYGGSAACANAAQNYKNYGAFYKSPMVGDQSFYFSGGGINHTGLVVDVGDTYYTAIEGNYSDQVSVVKHRLNGSDTAGFGRPNWSLVSNSDNQTAENAQNVQKPDFDCSKEDHKLTLPVLRYGSIGDGVKAMQSLLNLRNFNCGIVDGEIGTKTQAAINQFQRWAFPDNEKEWDGIFGNKCWTKLLERGDAL